ncbi:MAG: DNA polymerase I [Alphaproteobacteria bacterium]|nr:DNA polymerase I [Alphaproteobacteria bacterium]
MSDTKKNAPARHLYLIDASGFIFRAFHALPPLTRKDGTPVGAVLGFVNMLMKVMKDNSADAVAAVFDAGRLTFRNELYSQYKAHRPETPPELVPQFAIVREATRAFGLPAIELAGFEADDVIATYTKLGREAGYRVTIVSSDKDLMQLVEDHQVVLYDFFKNRELGRDEVKDRFGVGPERVVDVQALAGDSSDNVPGVPGIGVKTAAELINLYGDLDTLLARAGEIKQPKRRESLLENADKARLSRELVRLRSDVPVPASLDELAARAADPTTLRDFLEAQGFRSVLARLGLAGGAEKSPGAQIEPARTTVHHAPSSPSSASAPKPHVHVGKGAHYQLVQELGELKLWVVRAMAKGVVCVDTETTSLEPSRAALVGVSLAIEPGEACYVPLGHVREDLLGSEEIKQIPLKDAIACLRPMLEDESVLKIGHNIKYDLRIFARHGIAVAPVDDSMLLSFVLEGGSHGHGMDELAELHLSHKTITFKDVAGTGKNQVTFDKVPLDRARDYAAEDAEVTLRLYQLLKPRLVTEKLCTVYETIERPLIPVLARMESAGIKVDRAALARLSEDFSKRIAKFETEIHKLAGRSFNIGSPKQLGEILFDEMGLEGGKKGKTGAYGTDSDVLDGLAAQGHDLPARVLDWRQLSKLKSTYTDALLDYIVPETGRVHTSYAMTGAATGRLASSDPNLQNIPVRTEEGRKIREAFVAEKGNVLLSADYSQIELRILAHIANVDGLKEAFKQGTDIHALTASQVFGVPVEGMDPMVRRSAKAINFGIIYGISPFGLARQIGVDQGAARAYIEAYFKRYPGIRAYMDAAKETAHRQGYVTTLYGRRVHLGGINDKNPAMRGFSERAAINAPIQGTAADVIKRAMKRIEPALEKAKLSARMLLQVHDELVFEVPKDEAKETAALVKRVMEAAAELSVPLTVDTGIGDSWASAH